MNAGAADTPDSGMERIAELRDRLRELTALLDSPETSGDEAARLAREAADLLAEAGNEIEKALRATAERTGDR